MKPIVKTALTALLGSTAIAVIAPAAVAQDAPAAPPVTDDVIIIRGVNIPDEKRVTSEISAVLDDEAFQRTGDSDIGAALRRVTGLSLSQGKFVVVRGLNERYSTVTLDGSPLPSPEPLRRVVPLDIVPTSILSGSLVQKTYSPQFSAEFGGGLVELRTKSIPDEFYLEFGATVGIDTETSFSEGLSYEGGSKDWLGFDDGTRNAPFPATALFFGPQTNLTNLDQQALDIGFENANTTVITESQIPLNYGVNLGFGNFHELSNYVTFGYNFAGGFSNDFQTKKGSRERGLNEDFAGNPNQRAFSTDALPIEAELFDFESTTQVAEMNLLGSFGFQLGDNHTITSTSLMLRSTYKEARQSTGVIGEFFEDGEFLRENIEFYERQVWQSQLRGEHIFPGLGDLEATWRFAYGEAFRDAPYQRAFERARRSPTEEFAFQFGDTGNVSGSIVQQAINLQFSKVEDENTDAGIDFVWPFEMGDRVGDIKFGYNYTDKSRDTLVREFFYEPGVSASQFPDELRFARPDVLLSDAIVGTEVLDIQFQNNVVTLDNAQSSLEVNAAYLGLDIELSPYVRVALGGRYEESTQETFAFATSTGPNNTLNAAIDPIDEDYLLPAATFTWNPAADLQIRAGYSQTITRPQFRELTPALFFDDESDRRVVGNPFLVNSEIDNFDLRFEYYFARGQFFTIGAFFKDIENPIETTRDLIGESDTLTFINAPAAELFGFEVEFERDFVLADFFDGAMFETKDLVIRANYTYSESEVKVGSGDEVIIASISAANGATPRAVAAAADAGTGELGRIEDGRALQGQSEHLVNFQIGFEDVEKQSRATILVNWASERIRETENLQNNQAAVFERPPVTLDFVWSRTFEKLGGEWEAGFAVRNILGDDYEAVQDIASGEADFDTYELGREVSISLKRRF